VPRTLAAPAFDLARPRPAFFDFASCRPFAMNEQDQTGDEHGVSTRTAEISVALLLFAFGAIVVYDSNRLGSSWGSDGPQSGYFPFYIGSLICLSSVATLVQVLFAAWRARKAETAGAAAAPQEQFVTWGPFKRVLAVLIPSIVYVLFVQFIGLYVASAVYIALFMIWLGHYSWLRSAIVGLGVAIGIFLLFEIWFKVPLWKGTYDPLVYIGL
jgi:hypothetical protein